jgi:hypothetical protein
MILASANPVLGNGTAAVVSAYSSQFPVTALHAAIVSAAIAQSPLRQHLAAVSA